MTLPHHLIITVGTSILGNLSRAGFKEAMAPEQIQAVRAYLQNVLLSQFEAGAELNSSFQLLQQQKIHPQADLHLCVSDSAEGRFVGDLLQGRLEHHGQRVQMHVIQGLQDQDPVRFSREGLRNLVRLCGQIIQAAGGPQEVALNATGGYKAQIAVAALIGSAMGIPVYYKHEKFNSVIGFPPMPISLDDRLIERHLGYLLAAESTHPGLEVGPEEEALLALLDQEQIEDQTFYALSPLGQICLTSYEQRHPIETALPSPSPERKEPRFRDDHYPKGFQTYATKIWQECPYITQIVSLPYDRNRAIRNRYFYTRPDEPTKLIGEYVDKDGFGARFRIFSAASQPRQVQAVIRDLTQRYGEKI